MSKTSKQLAALIFSLTILTSCVSTPALVSDPRFYRKYEKNRIFFGTLDEVTYRSLQQVLANQTNSDLKDTIIIKYYYNDETCWRSMDEKGDDHVMGFVTRHNERMQTFKAARPNVSIFDFREPGNNVNKMVKWDNSIIIDSSKQLFNLLFNEPSICGNSIIVLPDKRFVFVRSDPHSDAMDFTQAQIVRYLSNK